MLGRGDLPAVVDRDRDHPEWTGIGGDAVSHFVFVARLDVEWPGQPLGWLIARARNRDFFAKSTVAWLVNLTRHAVTSRSVRTQAPANREAA